MRRMHIFLFMITVSLAISQNNDIVPSQDPYTYINVFMQSLFIGTWDEVSGPAAGFGETYRFYSNGSFKKVKSTMETIKDPEYPLLYTGGKYYIDGNTITLSFEVDDIIKDGKAVYVKESYMPGWYIENGVETIVPTKNRNTYKVMVSSIELKPNGKFIYPMIIINGKRYYKKSNNPDESS